MAQIFPAIEVGDLPESEAAVLLRLQATLDEDDVVICRTAFMNDDSDSELDFLVMMPDLGFVFLEAKGGRVSHADGVWWTTQGDDWVRIDPVAQARNGLYRTWEYLESHPVWGSRSRVNSIHSVAVPFADFSADFELPDLRRAALHDHDDLINLGGRLRSLVTKLGRGSRPPTLDDSHAVVEALVTREQWQDGPAFDAARREQRAQTLTQEQAMLLEVTRLLPRVEVRGAAGCGKTVLALHQARSLTKGRHDRKAQRVALICYTVGLASWLKREVGTWPRNDRPAFVGTFHELGALWGASFAHAKGGGQDFWEDELPREMAELAAALPAGKRFGAIVVDEAQDFADLWWHSLFEAMTDRQTSGLYTYTDPDQAVFTRRGSPGVPMVRWCSTATCATPNRSSRRFARSPNT